MGRPKIPKEEKRQHVSITLTKDVLKMIEKINNKSELINKLLEEYFEKQQDDIR